MIKCQINKAWLYKVNHFSNNIYYNNLLKLLKKRQVLWDTWHASCNSWSSGHLIFMWPKGFMEGGLTVRFIVQDRDKDPAYGVDVLRWWATLANLDTKVNIGSSILQRCQEQIFKVMPFYILQQCQEQIFKVMPFYTTAVSRTDIQGNALSYYSSIRNRYSR